MGQYNLFYDEIFHLPNPTGDDESFNLNDHRVPTKKLISVTAQYTHKFGFSSPLDFSKFIIPQSMIRRKGGKDKYVP